MKVLILTCSLSKFDAVSNDIFLQKKILEEEGYQTKLYSINSDEFYRPLVLSKSEIYRFLNDSSTIIIYHHSTHFPGVEEILKVHKGKKIFKYHNVTPKEFFEKFNSLHAGIVEEGRKQTEILLTKYNWDKILSASSYNQLEIFQFIKEKNIFSVLSPFHFIEDLKQMTLDSELVTTIRQVEFPVLFVGRVVPNKRIDWILEVLYFYKKFYKQKIHLFIIGKELKEFENYNAVLRKTIQKFGLKNDITFVPNATPSHLFTFYKTCKAFLCLSEHEGFCMPILEAQTLSLPIVALKKTAVKETLGESYPGLEEYSPEVAVEFLHRICIDQRFRTALAEEGRKNSQEYTFEKMKSLFLDELKAIA